MKINQQLVLTPRIFFFKEHQMVKKKSWLGKCDEKKKTLMHRIQRTWVLIPTEQLADYVELDILSCQKQQYQEKYKIIYLFFMYIIYTLKVQ